MARQTFVEGQTVYCHRGGITYRKAIVMRPDMVKGGRRQTHYVGVRYINAKGQPEGAEWPITNRANLILTEEAFNQINRAKKINNLHRDIAAYAHFERDFQPYFDQAQIIIRTLSEQGHPDPDDVNELAHYLRGMFGFIPSYSRLDRNGVRALRADKRAEASQARGELASMGEDVPELADAVGA